jgi:4'-phosphopantetheinyl transferase
MMADRKARRAGVDEHNVFIWWMETSRVEASAWPTLLTLLSGEERARAGKFHFERDRQTYVCAHAMGRSLLSSVAGGDPAAWQFAIHEHGKPEVVAPTSGPRWRLNLSHTRGMAAAVLTQDVDVGVDVEWLQRSPDCVGLARRFFAPEEVALLNTVPSDRQRETFLTLWTLKESYIKAIGKGLAQPLDSFFFTLDPLAIHFPPTATDDPANWKFQRQQPSSDHLLAVAVHCRQSPEMAIQTRSIRAEDLLS